jgi:hypothetical protein
MGFRRADNFLEHRRAIDFLPQNEVLIPQLLFHPLSVVEVGSRNVPADNAPAFVFERVVLNKLPAILPALEQGPHFQLEWVPTQQPLLTLGSDPVNVVRMEDSRKEAFVVHLGHGESGEIQRHPVRVECRTIRRQDHDGLANGIGNCAKVRRLLELLLGALKVVNVCIDPTPADEAALLVVNGRR